MACSQRPRSTRHEIAAPALAALIALVPTYLSPAIARAAPGEEDDVASRSVALATGADEADAARATEMALAGGSDAVVQQVTELNRKALESYETLEFERARKLLKQALDLCASAGLDTHPIKARTHIHMGVVLIVGFKQRDLGKKQFEKAIELQSNIQVTKSLANPDVQSVFSEVSAGGGGGAGEPAATQATDEEDEDGAEPAARPQARPAPRRTKTCAEGDDDCDEDGEIGARFFIAAMGGLGVGYATGEGELNPANSVTSPGFAPSSAGHLAPEVGYFLSRSLMVSFQLRFQIVQGATPVNLDKLAMVSPGTDVERCGSDHLCSPTTSAIAGLARASWFFEPMGVFRPFVSAAVGGGQIRHLVSFSAEERVCGTKGDQTCKDTVISGPVFLGPGAGALFAFSETFGLLLQANTFLGFPSFTFHIDVNGGVALRF